MRNLSPTLLAAQRSPIGVPYVKVEARDTIAEVTRLNFTRLYNGGEADYFHAAAQPADGSLIRARITPTSDARKLYYQRVTSPGETSNFSQWVYAGQYNSVVVAAAALGAEVSIFWIKSDHKIQRIKSVDNGASWSSPELIDYSVSSAINGICAAYKPSGDLSLFFADQQTLYVKKYLSGQWQARTAWDKTTGDLSGVSVVYDDDWNVFVTGKDTAGNFKLWSLVYGDGGAVSSGSWSELKEIATAPAASGYEYRHASLAKPDVFRCFYVEKYGGEQSYSRPFWTHTADGSTFSESLWREAVPFNLSSDYGLAVTHHGDYCWLSSPNGVWRAALNAPSIDLSSDVLSLKQESNTDSGKLIVELRNDDGRYGTLPELLKPGNEIYLSPGYLTPQDNEVSQGQSFQITAYEYRCSGGKSSLMLYAEDAWHLLENWRARHQFRWNQGSGQKAVKDMLAFVLAKAGIKLEVISNSAAISNFYPDFTINPGDSGKTIVLKLLTFVPDIIFIEGNRALLLNPLSSNAPCYTFGASHPIFEGRYRQTELIPNCVRVEGWNATTGTPILTSVSDWDAVESSYDSLEVIEDQNIGSVTQAQERGEAVLRKSVITSADGLISVPPNCGQQIYDVIEINDPRSGLYAVKRRVLGLSLSYSPPKGEYRQKITLGAV
jgi:hypothetical protein